MEEAIKAISTMRGHDLRDFMLLAFGGAGPLHAGRIARDLGMAGVIVPLYPGVLFRHRPADVRRQARLHPSKLTPLSEISPADVNGMFERMVAQALDELRDDGFSAEQIRIERALDMRYAGQGYEIAMPCAAHSLQDADLKQLRATFDQQHRTMFGHMRAGGAGRDRFLSRARHRPRAAGRDAEIQADRHHSGGCAAGDAARAFRWQGR